MGFLMKSNLNEKDKEIEAVYIIFSIQNPLQSHF